MRMPKMHKTMTTLTNKMTFSQPMIGFPPRIYSPKFKIKRLQTHQAVLAGLEVADHPTASTMIVIRTKVGDSKHRIKAREITRRFSIVTNVKSLFRESNRWVS